MNSGHVFSDQAAYGPGPASAQVSAASTVSVGGNRLLTRKEWKALFGVWFVIVGAFLLAQVFKPAAGAWFAVWLLVAMINGGRMLPAMLMAGVPLTYSVTPGANLSVVEVGLMIAGLASLASAPKRLGPVFMPVMAYLGVCFLSMGIAFLGKSAVVSWVQTAVYLVLAVSVFGHFVKDGRQLLVAAIALMGTSAFLAVLMVSQGGSGFVFGIHKNSFGATTAASVVCAMGVWLHVRQTRKPKGWTWLLIFLSLGLFLSLSRGAWASAVVGGIALAMVYRQWRVVVSLALIAIPVAALGYYLLPETQQQYVLGSVDTDSHSYGTRSNNAGIAWRYFMENPLIGSGIGLRKQNDATNVVLFTLAETGVLGIVAFLWIHVSAGRTLLRSYRVAPPGSLTLMAAGIAMALLFGRLAHGLVDHYWSRGAISAAWCLVGAAMALTQSARRQAVMHTLEMRQSMDTSFRGPSS